MSSSAYAFGRLPTHGRCGRPLYAIDKKTGCFFWLLAKDKDGYGVFTQNGRSVKAHRRFYEIAKGPIPPGFSVDHLCRHRDCVNPAHLEAVSPAENVRRGNRAKHLTMGVARQIRQMCRTGVRYVDVAERFGVSKSLVGQIAANWIWRESDKPLADEVKKGQPSLFGQGGAA